jgi:putative glutamine amidotransferase
MKRIVSLIILVSILFVFSIDIHGKEEGPVVFAMCQPLVSQVQNIEVMFERDIITLDRVHLICVYHEDESTDYSAAREYVEKNGLRWVTFETIKGKVDTGDLFRENNWTAQFRAIFDRTAGIIFTGGMDIPPSIYREEKNLLTEVETPNRHYYEISFLFHLIGGSRNEAFVPFLESRKDYVVLGICLGAQSMNVAAGGSLYQDIPTQVYGLKTVEQVLMRGRDEVHSSRYFKGLYPLEKGFPPAFHRVNFLKGGFFPERMGMSVDDKPYVLTSHHQALKELGKGLKAAAVSMDGKIIEAVEHRLYRNVLGVQFHPEYSSLYMKGRFFREVPDGPLDLNLRSFLNANPPSMKFHKAIWQWFSESLSKSFSARRAGPLCTARGVSCCMSMISNP